MISVYHLLEKHAAAYPQMQPCDAVKLLYQRVFGGGHLVRSGDDAAAYIRREYDSIPHEKCRRVEILGETARVYLDSPYTPDELELLAKVFCVSSRRFCADWSQADASVKKEWEQALDDLRRAAQTGVFSFSPAELEQYLTEYKSIGYPAVRHSETYREAYSPAYRVIDSRYARILELLFAIRRKMQQSHRVVVAIDGRCASGKSTAAQCIERIFEAETIHMDDFFLPGPMRTPQRMEEVGGNLHRERFIEEVLPQLRHESFSYRVFQCSTFTYAAEPRTIGNAPLRICEGSYSLHPAFGDYCDIAVFSDVEPTEQLRRIRERDGEFMLTRFQNEWIPMEERYFDENKLRDRCDFVL